MNKLAELFTGPQARDWYNLVTALRGPDLENTDLLKEIVTARIRWLSLSEGGKGATVIEAIDFPGDLHSRTKVSMFSLEQAFTEAAAHTTSIAHFASHARYALDSLQRLNYISEEEASFWRAFLHLYEGGYETAPLLLAGKLREDFPEFVSA